MTTHRLTLLWLIGTGLLLLLIGARLAFPDTFTKHATSSGASNRPATSSQPEMRQPTPLGALPQPGKPVNAVFLERSPVERRQLTATLLRREELGNYRRTNTTVTVVWRNPTAPLQMGKARDLKPGAMLQVIGRVGKTHTVLAARLIVLTGYVNLA
jgi:hypothetical protein